MQYQWTGDPYLNQGIWYRPWPQLPAGLGWICPACGKGNAPWVQQCPCEGQQKFTITWTNASEGAEK